jgi:hypothetical protein
LESEEENREDKIQMNWIENLTHPMSKSSIAK